MSQNNNNLRIATLPDELHDAWKSIILASARGLVFGIGLSVILVVIINAILTLIQP